ncbi:alpha/beta hydrolase [Paucibacter sp. APW11]|uniref:Alpha/beta hydrolase n=1 Tax=Roseateles aquae TaxID=3077235 RepID=A0ABU3PF06_9BURK|nr:alpha/beta hydrolase [Paucibacter sp. APW11]MDT9001103.1 alpha/beta hydrolase [Paucibacter sp. APW11]
MSASLPDSKKTPVPAVNPASLFYARGPVQRVLRGLFAGLQRLSPALAGAAAMQLFRTPLPPRWAGSAAAWPAVWQRHSLPFEGGQLRFWRRGAADAGHRPAVLLLHGWGGRAQDMAALAERLWQAGFAPLLPDLPAHGRSSGWRSDMPQWLRAIQALSAAHGPWHAVVGHSLGALAAAHSVAAGLPAQRLVLLAVSPPPRQILHWFAAGFGLRAGVQQHMAAWFAQRGAALERFEPAWLGSRLVLPTLLLHDEADRAAPLAHALAMQQQLPTGRMQLTQGLGHRRLLRDEAVLEAVRRHLGDAA